MGIRSLSHCCFLPPLATGSSPMVAGGGVSPSLLSLSSPNSCLRCSSTLTVPTKIRNLQQGHIRAPIPQKPVNWDWCVLEQAAPRHWTGTSVP